MLRSNKDIVMKLRSETDIDALKKIFKIKNINYINIQQDQQVQGIIKQWPLIAELHSLQKDLKNK